MSYTSLRPSAKTYVLLNLSVIPKEITDCTYLYVCTISSNLNTLHPQKDKNHSLYRKIWVVCHDCWILHCRFEFYVMIVESSIADLSFMWWLPNFPLQIWVLCHDRRILNGRFEFHLMIEESYTVDLRFMTYLLNSTW